MLVLPEDGDVEVDVLAGLPAEPEVDRPSTRDPPPGQVAEEIQRI